MATKFPFHRDRSGAAAVEFALIAPMLVAILLPMVDLGIGAYQKMRVQDAAEAGAQYALKHGYSSASISSAAQNATSLGGSLSVTPSEACDCVSGGALASAPCGSTCADGSAAGTYVTVGTSTSYSLLLKYPGLTNPMTLTGNAVVRIN
ncbi:MAG: TadE/TadG family type IV pilus assembly protein [Stellaceae bacterium]